MEEVMEEVVNLVWSEQREFPLELLIIILEYIMLNYLTLSVEPLTSTSGDRFLIADNPLFQTDTHVYWVASTERSRFSELITAALSPTSVVILEKQDTWGGKKQWGLRCVRYEFQRISQALRKPQRVVQEGTRKDTQALQQEGSLITLTSVDERCFRLERTKRRERP